MPIIRWDPSNDIERFIADRAQLPAFPKLGWDLAVDVFEEKGSVIAKMSLPGIDVNNIDISIDEDELIISGAREEEHEVDEKDYYTKEIRRGSFMRTVDLPKEVNAAKTKAEYSDGVLKIIMPVVGKVKDQSVKVKVAKK